MEFEWDAAKNRANVEKHGVSFEMAARIFEGYCLTRPDDRFDYGETREISIGVLEGVAVLVVVHTDRAGRCRIISARPAKRSERVIYEQALQTAPDG